MSSSNVVAVLLPRCLLGYILSPVLLLSPSLISIVRSLIMADFDSDDLQFSEVELPERNSKAGQKSIDQIFDRAAADRISSKRVVKQLQFGRGAPSTRAHQTGSDG